jgi:simple sugar transport system substrate-binding protein
VKMNPLKAGRRLRARLTRTPVAVALVLMAVAFLTACGESSDSSTSTGSDTAASGQKLKIIQVAAAPTSEPFSSVEAKGLEQAAKDFNLDVEWRGPTRPNPSDPSEQLRLIENAIASKPDGLIIADTFAEQYNPVIKRAVDQGIPVMLADFGRDDVEKVGALGFVGEDDLIAGQLAGAEMARRGPRHALVIGLPPGIPAFDARVEGFKKGFTGTTSVLEVPMQDINDTTKVRNLILTELQKDSSIDGVWPIGPGIGTPVLAAYDRLGSEARRLVWGQGGIDKATLEALQQGKYSFSVDNQQFLRSYVSAMWLNAYLRYGLRPAESFIQTGPALVTTEEASNLAKQRAAMMP